MTERAGSKTARRCQAAVRRLLALSLALVALVLLGVAVLLSEGSRRLDELKVREDRFLIANAVNRIGGHLVSDMTAVTVWDQAYRNLRPGGDPAWADGHQALAVFLSRLGRRDQALRHAQQAAELNPGSAGALSNYRALLRAK